MRHFGEVTGKLASHETSALLGIGGLWQLRADEDDPDFDEKERTYWSVAKRHMRSHQDGLLSVKDVYACSDLKPPPLDYDDSKDDEEESVDIDRLTGR